MSESNHLLPLQFSLRQYHAESLPEPTVEDLTKGKAPIREVSEYAYSQYKSLVQKEQEPELIITVPPRGASQPTNSTSPFNSPEAVTSQLDAAAAPASYTQHTPGNRQETVAAPASHATPQPNGSAAEGVGTPFALSTHNKATHDMLTPEQSNLMQSTPAVAANNGTVTVTIYFSKEEADSSVVFCGDYVMTNAQLRRSRGWFPCVDAPVYTYAHGGPFCIPYTFDFIITVQPTDVVVCSGTLVQQSLSVDGVMPDGKDNVVSRTFIYAVTTPTLPAHISLVVGPFDITPGSTILTGPKHGVASSTGTGVTVFTPQQHQHVLPQVLHTTLLQDDSS